MLYPITRLLFAFILLRVGVTGHPGSGSETLEDSASVDKTRLARGSAPGGTKYEGLLTHKKGPSPPASHKKAAPVTTPAPETHLPDGEEGGSESFSRPTWSETKSDQPGCKEKCKAPPTDAACAPVNIYDKTVPRASGPNAQCCPTLKCFMPDGSYFPFHGIQGKGPITTVAIVPPPSAAPSPPTTTTTPKPGDPWGSSDSSTTTSVKHHEHGIEVNVVATGSDDAIANAVDDDALPAAFDEEMYNMEKEMAKMSAQMDADMGDMMNMKFKRAISPPTHTAASYATMLYGAMI
ncbi:uncharacterized protein LOC110842296 [Folsomia candida]|uniref:Uncharacterized protein n=1 Tax=Folsomia candida TaxID=158441 RepID=A0A226F048_FOLCA|nr:uncharacterized protein LOC110842296 [Folsomia candida]OXA62838.1 hypothetical protein Fcan01_04012 [Folsomia candida]